MTRRRSASPQVRRRVHSEDEIRTAAKRYVQGIGGLHKRMHFGPGATVGWPDDLFMFLPSEHGWRLIPHMCWVEFKATGKKAEAIQLHTHELMREYGQLVFVCNSIEQFHLVVARVSNGMPLAIDAGGFPRLAGESDSVH